MTEDNVAIRLKLLINKLGLNNSAFAEACGLSRATLSQLLTGRNKKISDVVIAQIHKAFPEVSILWLLFNEGEMINNDSQKTSDNIENANEFKGSGDISEFDLENEVVQAGNAYNNPKYSDDDTAFQKNDKENRVKSVENDVKIGDAELVKYQSKIDGLQTEIDNLKKKVKKVVQITVYYNDSTFENFYPH